LPRSFAVLHAFKKEQEQNIVTTVR